MNRPRADCTENPEDLVPLEKVLEDMNNPDGGIPASGARAYYYMYYASDKERVQMDFEDKITSMIGKVIAMLFLSGTVFAIVMGILEAIK